MNSQDEELEKIFRVSILRQGCWSKIMSVYYYTFASAALKQPMHPVTLLWHEKVQKYILNALASVNPDPFPAAHLADTS